MSQVAIVLLTGRMHFFSHSYTSIQTKHRREKQQDKSNEARPDQAKGFTSGTSTA
jgi:hypothetical protein